MTTTSVSIPLSYLSHSRLSLSVPSTYPHGVPSTRLHISHPIRFSMNFNHHQLPSWILGERRSTRCSISRSGSHLLLPLLSTTTTHQAQSTRNFERHAHRRYTPSPSHRHPWRTNHTPSRWRSKSPRSNCASSKPTHNRHRRPLLLPLPHPALRVGNADPTPPNDSCASAPSARRSSRDIGRGRVLLTRKRRLGCLVRSLGVSGPLLIRITSRSTWTGLMCNGGVLGFGFGFGLALFLVLLLSSRFLAVVLLSFLFSHSLSSVSPSLRCNVL